MSNPSQPSAAMTAVVPALVGPEKRSSRRVRIARPLRVRPSRPDDKPFEEVLATINASRDGLYFATGCTHYYVGMGLSVVLPYHTEDAFRTEYLGRVVRIDTRRDGRLGVAVQLISTFNLLAATTPSWLQRK